MLSALDVKQLTIIKQQIILPFHVALKRPVIGASNFLVVIEI